MITLCVVGLFLLPLVQGDCKPGWESFGRSCYLFTTVNEKYSPANSYCKAQGGRLATIEDEAENTFLKTTAKKKGKVGYILGGSRVHGGNWTWANGHGPHSFNFTDWYPGQPGDKLCLWMLKCGGYRWYGRHCGIYGKASTFICESP